MTLRGDPGQWLDLMDSQVPAILELILSTWNEMPPLAPDALEDPTTDQLCRALRKNRSSADLPLRIDVQMVELEPAAGQRQGRLDIVFSPLVPSEAIYFCLECKRLNVTRKGRRFTLGTEYVAQGMLRFVERQYGGRVRHGGMLGYVLDGRVDLAVGAVRAAIRRRRQDLRLSGEPGLRPSSFLPRVANIFETAHDRDGARSAFLLQHVFAAAI